MKNIVFLCTLMGTVLAYSQVGIGTTTPSEASMLEVSGTTTSGDFRGFMPPRVPTETDRDAIPATATDIGLMVYVQSINCLQMWNGSFWESVHCITSATDVWINEFHYQNIGGDIGEFVEVAGTAGLDLTGYSIELYNGADGSNYATLSFTAGTTIPDEGGGFGAVSISSAGMQNGAPDGLALVDASANVILFLSYQGSFVATGGTVNGMTSIDVGVAESDATTPIGSSLQLVGTGSAYGDFTWAGPAVDSSGTINAGQTIN